MRRVFLLSLLVSLSLFVNAQRFNAGLLFGLSASQVHGDNLSGFDKMGLVGGGFVKTSINEKWDAFFEIIYVQKGSRKIPNPSKGDYLTYDLKLDYAEVPVLVRYTFYKQFALEFGPAFGALVRQSEVSNDINLLQVYPEKAFSKTDFTFVTGINYLFQGKFDINIRYTNSYLPVRRFDVPVYYPNWFFNLFNRGFYNNVLTFTARYTFGVKKENNITSEPVLKEE